MNRYLFPSRFRGTAICGFGLLWLSTVISAQESRIDDGKGIEVLASGPVHEAFAEPIVFDPKPGFMAPKAPPELVEELPPDQKPVGANVAWVPGYWSWDEDRENFLWVSGFWRALPPGREWVPGYWAEVTGGWQWVSGFWANAGGDGTEYLPEPPQSLEAGPSTMAPSADHFWVPGCWYWADTRYVWRPGYWTAGLSDWIWSPAHYVWTPRGFVFVSGYWDYSVPRRGMLFAPVYFNSPLYSRPGYFYTPRMAVNLAILTNHFFVGLGQRHYYFGDYYSASYGNRGVYPWFAFASSRYGYDPIYAHYHQQHIRKDRNWADGVRSDYEFRRDHENARPARIASLTPRIQRQDGLRADGEQSLVQPLAQFAAAPGIRGTIEPLPNNRRLELTKVAQETREFTKRRMKTESDPNAQSHLSPAPDSQSKKPNTQFGQETKSSIVKRPKSPIADVPKPDASRNTNGVGTALPETPKADQKGQRNAPDNGLPAVPKAIPKGESKRPAPDKPVVPKLEPKPPVKTPDVPKVEPPKVRPEVPKAEPPPKIRPVVPKVEPPPKVRPEVPKVEPPPKVRPEVPRAEPKPPKVSPPAGDKPKEPKQKPPKPGKEPKK